MPVTATEQTSKAAKSKMLVGNAESSAVTMTLTASATERDTATTTSKLSNQDNQNKRVPASGDHKYLRHAMLGNFNQQNVLWRAKQKANNKNNNNDNDINSFCGNAGELHNGQRLLRLNGEMNYVNNMQQATATTTVRGTRNVCEMKVNDASNMHTFNNNNTSCQHVMNYEQRHDNEESLSSQFQLPMACNTIPTTRTATSAAALSVAAISTRESALLKGPAGTRKTTSTSSCTELLPLPPLQLQTSPLPRPPPTLVAQPLLSHTVGVKMSTSRCGTNGALDGGFGNKMHSDSGSMRRRKRGRRKHFSLKRPSYFKRTMKIESQSENAKINATMQPSVAKSISKATTLNFGVLTSFILNSTLLALCNATAATALSAVVATLSETISDYADADPQLPLDSDAWSKMQNMSFTNANDSFDAIGRLAWSNGSFNGSDMSFNNSDALEEEKDREYIFDRIDVRIIFITLYTLVFCCCFFGNLLVILVVTLSRRLRSITNFFLANLALADFCVGLFCVLQNLSIYLIESWVFGEFLCRMYQYVHSLSYTASIFILVVICMERYFAIVHPITCKQILTAARLRLAILVVWVASAIYSTPKFIFSKTIKNIHTKDGQEEEICVLDRMMFNSVILDMINFVLLYVIPLLVMTVLYSKIAIALWRSSHGLSHHSVPQHQQQQQQQQQLQQSQQQQDESMSLHNSMYHHQHPHPHPHQSSHHHHHHHHVQHNHHPLQTAAHNINHHHNHLQQTQTAQPLSGVALTSTPVVGVVGMSSGDVVICGAASQTRGLLSRKQSSKYEKRGVSITESQYEGSQVSLDSDRPIVSACRNGSNNNGNSSGISGGSMNSNHKSSFMQHHHHSSAHPHPHQRTRVTHTPHSSNGVLRARRGVVRMLIIFVLTFALCNLPYHARKIWQYWSHSYRGDSNFNALLTPLTFLVSYFNSGINPLLYAFLSRNFRKGMKEVLLCTWKKGKGKSSSNSSVHHKRAALQTHSLPTDTTHIGNEQL
ncbi:trissin receptor isoform X2 [Anastrepha ludens]|uniref:trissin receptor isoform X2 n=1 Tax=Anastrepha ludens TaxID=28586 RepID=UPI0023B0333E|nr:trissin receptor isoform X2 [Anastrepha ludens]